MTSPNLSARKKVWRNLMISAINEGLAQGRIDLIPKPDEGDRDIEITPWQFEAQGFLFTVQADHIGHGEISIHVIFNPATGPLAEGWLERQTGPYLMSNDKTKGILNRCPRSVHAAFSTIMVEPNGYEDNGRFII